MIIYTLNFSCQTPMDQSVLLHGVAAMAALAKETNKGKINQAKSALSFQTDSSEIELLSKQIVDLKTENEALSSINTQYLSKLEELSSLQDIVSTLVGKVSLFNSYGQLCVSAFIKLCNLYFS